MLLRSFLAVIGVAAVSQAASDWPQFRGPQGDGHADAKGLPLTWSEKENVRWKTPLPGEGWSSPVVGDGRVWLTASLNDGHSLRAVCVDSQSGKLRHDVEVFQIAAPESINVHVNTHASPTPALAGGRLYVSYGTHGSACLDAATGQVLWRNSQLRLFHDNNGAGSSPIVFSNLFIVHCDGVDVRYIAALKTASGELAWATRRSNVIPGGGGANKAFCTPLMVELSGKPSVLSVAAHRVSTYEPATGRELWAVDLPGNVIVPRPVVRDGVAFVCTGFPKPELWAIKLAGQGVVDETTAVVWKYKKQVPQVPSPALVDDRLYTVSDNGILTCLDANTGKEIFSERLEGTFFASPLVAEGRLYLSNKEGKTFVVAGKGKFEVLATNSLADGCHASLAVAGKSIYLRSSGHLYRIEKSE
jgi:outer membrane protein assembly factor BamB